MDNGHVIEKKIMRELEKRLPETIEHSWSSRIEGMMESTPGQGSFDKILLLIDQNLSDEKFSDLSECMMNALRCCRQYKNTKIRIKFWDGEYDNDRFMFQKIVRDVLASLQMNPTRSGTQDDLESFLREEVTRKKCPLILILADNSLAEMIQKMERILYKKLIILTWNNDQEIKPVKSGASIFTYVKKDIGE